LSSHSPSAQQAPRHGVYWLAHQHSWPASRWLRLAGRGCGLDRVRGAADGAFDIERMSHQACRVARR